jgi:hypothetical protein
MTRTFDDYEDRHDAFSDAPPYCREKGSPVTVIVDGEKWKLFSSGRAEYKGRATHE